MFRIGLLYNSKKVTCITHEDLKIAVFCWCSYFSKSRYYVFTVIYTCFCLDESVLLDSHFNAGFPVYVAYTTQITFLFVCIASIFMLIDVFLYLFWQTFASKCRTRIIKDKKSNEDSKRATFIRRFSQQYQHEILVSISRIQKGLQILNNFIKKFHLENQRCTLDTSVLGFEIAALFKKSISVALLLALIGAHI